MTTRVTRTRPHSSPQAQTAARRPPRMAFPAGVAVGLGVASLDPTLGAFGLVMATLVWALVVVLDEVKSIIT